MHYCHPTRDLESWELLLAAVVRTALRDARGRDERLKEEAIRWLWDTAPGVARKADLPAVIATDNALNSY